MHNLHQSQGETHAEQLQTYTRDSDDDREILSSQGRPPLWRRPADLAQGRTDQPAKTSELAVHERGLLVKALRRDGSAEAFELAGRIVLVKAGPAMPQQRRLPRHARATQRLFVRACRNVFDDHGQDMVTVNIICYWAGIDRGRLADHDDLFEETRGRLRDASPTWPCERWAASTCR